MPRDEFGLPTVPFEEDSEFDFLKDAQPEETQEVPQETPAEEAAPVEEPQVEEAAPEEKPEGEEPPQPQLYAGKYETVEQLQQGYREIRDLQRRTAERAKAQEQKALEAIALARQNEEMLGRAVAMIQQIQSQQTPQPPPKPVFDEYGRPVEQAPQPQQPQITPAVVDWQVEQKMNALRQQLAQENRIQRETDEATRTVMSFYEKHPEVEVHGPIDSDIYNTVQSLNEAWPDSVIDISDQRPLRSATKLPRTLTCERCWS